MSIFSNISLSKKEATCWGCLLGVLCIAFSPLFFSMIWGNHDWIPMMFGNPLDAGLIEGRFSQYVFINIFLMGNILPIFNILFGFIIYTLALILLCTRFFKFSLDSKKSFLILTTVATLPFIIEILYFQFIISAQLCWPIVIVLSLIYATKATTEKKLINLAISTILLLFTVGGYPAAVNLYVTAAGLYLLQKHIQETKIKNILYQAILFIIPLIFSLSILIIIHQWLRENGYMADMYNAHTSSLSTLLQKLPLILEQSLYSFIRIQPYFELSFKLLTTIIILIFTISCLLKCKNFTEFSFRTFLLIGILLCLKFSAWLTDETGNYFTQFDPAVYMVRTDFYVVPCLLMFCLFQINTAPSNIIKNLLLLLTSILFWINIKTDIYYTKISILGFTTENLLLQRLTDRIQSNKQYRSYADYTVVQTGELAMRSRFYYPAPFQKYGYYTLQIPNTRFWMPYEYFNFYALEPFVINNNNIDPYLMSDQMKNWIQNHTAVWPSENAIYLDNNYIVVILNPDGKKALTEQFKTLQAGIR